MDGLCLGCSYGGDQGPARDAGGVGGVEREILRPVRPARPVEHPHFEEDHLEAVGEVESVEQGDAAAAEPGAKSVGVVCRRRRRRLSDVVHSVANSAGSVHRAAQLQRVEDGEPVAGAGASGVQLPSEDQPWSDKEAPQAVHRLKCEEVLHSAGSLLKPKGLHGFVWI